MLISGGFVNPASVVRRFPANNTASAVIEHPAIIPDFMAPLSEMHP